jgi:hypothetical protein
LPDAPASLHSQQIRSNQTAPTGSSCGAKRRGRGVDLPTFVGRPTWSRGSRRPVLDGMQEVRGSNPLGSTAKRQVSGLVRRFRKGPDPSRTASSQQLRAGLSARGGPPETARIVLLGSCFRRLEQSPQRGDPVGSGARALPCHSWPTVRCPGPAIQRAPPDLGVVSATAEPTRSSPIAAMGCGQAMVCGGSAADRTTRHLPLRPRG